MIAYILAQVNSKKKLSPSDIATFKWDENNGIEEEHITSISDEDIERLKEISKQWEK